MRKAVRNVDIPGQQIGRVKLDKGAVNFFMDFSLKGNSGDLIIAENFF